MYEYLHQLHLNDLKSTNGTWENTNPNTNRSNHIYSNQVTPRSNRIIAIDLPNLNIFSDKSDKEIKSRSFKRHHLNSNNEISSSRNLKRTTTSSFKDCQEANLVNT